MISQKLLDILRCPHCAPEGREGLLDLVRDSWLVCRECGRKYPIQDDLPYMLVEIGDQWMHTPNEELPVPPDMELAAPAALSDQELGVVGLESEALQPLKLPRWLALIPFLVGVILLIRWLMGRWSCQCGEDR